MARVVALSGNPRPASRTLQLAVDVANVIDAALGGTGDVLVVDLATRAPVVFDQRDPAMIDLVASVARCDVIVCTSPVYKATYTGLLKAFLDRYPTDGLRGTVAVPVMMGGAPNHAMAADVSLRPLLVELGAMVPSPSLYVLDSQLDTVGDQIAGWASRAVAPIVACVEAAVGARHRGESQE